MRSVARQMGGTLKVGRRRETVSPLFLGPTLHRVAALARPRHDPGVGRGGRSSLMRNTNGTGKNSSRECGWNEERNGRNGIEMTSSKCWHTPTSWSKRRISCAVWSTPARRERGNPLAKRGRLFHQAELPNRGRRVRVWLTAIPMGASANSVAAPFGEQIRDEESQLH